MRSFPSSNAGPDSSLEVLWERVSRSARGEIVSDELIDALMRATIEYAAVERGLLILAQREEYWIEAEATSGSDTVSVNLRKTRVTAADLPELVLRHAVRTKNSVFIQD